MLFNSIDFLIFFPIVTLVYFLIPQRVRYLWLLAASYYFYMSWNPKYALLMVASTVVTWASALLLTGWGGDSRARRRLCLVACIVFNLGILFFFKYYNFAAGTLTALLGRVGLRVQAPAFDVILPVGISFYTFQALGYVTDVYRGEIPAERNLLRYATFISFFPQLVAGPIERSRNLMGQMYEEHYFDPVRVRDGLLLMGWGLFEKLVIADRIAPMVTNVYENYAQFTGLQIGAATVLFAFQIYCDFAGYSDIAIGAAQVMGFRLMKNFNCPYYSTSVTQFWRNWHISLTTWFRDNIYIPLGGNRQGKAKKYRNQLITFGLSGLWHGASWNYVAWGLLNGVYLVIGDATRPFRDGLRERLGMTEDKTWVRLVRGLITFAFVDLGWVFFRANRFLDALGILRHSAAAPGLTHPGDILAISTMEGTRSTLMEWAALFAGLLVLAVVDYYKRRTDLRALLGRQKTWVRYGVYYVLFFAILIFGVYGPEYDASAFIYFQF